MQGASRLLLAQEVQTMLAIANNQETPTTLADARWQAVVNRDRGRDGEFVFAVSTTGIYCRPSCPARRPRPENVQLFRRLRCRRAGRVSRLPSLPAEVGAIAARRARGAGHHLARRSCRRAGDAATACRRARGQSGAPATDLYAGHRGLATDVCGSAPIGISKVTTTRRRRCDERAPRRRLWVEQPLLRPGAVGAGHDADIL